MCCRPWGHKDAHMSERLNNNSLLRQQTFSSGEDTVRFRSGALQLDRHELKSQVHFLGLLGFLSPLFDSRKDASNEFYFEILRTENNLQITQHSLMHNRGSEWHLQYYCCNRFHIGKIYLLYYFWGSAPHLEESFFKLSELETKTLYVGCLQNSNKERDSHLLSRNKECFDGFNQGAWSRERGSCGRGRRRKKGSSQMGP